MPAHFVACCLCFMRFCIVLFTLMLCATANSDTVAQLRIATASNFSHVMQFLVQEFEAQTEHTIDVVTGSTGKQYAHITQGAPFDLFLAADSAHPQSLEQKGTIVAGTRFTYAIGQLVLWSPDAELINNTANVLRTRHFLHLAIANPVVAPYGMAAQQVMQALGVWQTDAPYVVRGENVAQALHFVQSGNAQLGFVAYSHLVALGLAHSGSLWKPNPELHQPIVQQAVLLRDTPVARQFMRFLQSKTARTIIRQQGYQLPPIP